MSGPRQGQPAGFVSRATAFLLDAVIFGASTSLAGWTTTQVAVLFADPSFRDDLSLWIVTIGGSVLAIAYQVISWTAFGRTPGKALLGLAVITPNGSRPGVLRSLVRFGGYLLSAIPLGLGFLWILVDDHRRGWHDLVAGTRVVYREGARARERHAAGDVFSPVRSG